MILTLVESCFLKFQLTNTHSPSSVQHMVSMFKKIKKKLVKILWGYSTFVFYYVDACSYIQGIDHTMHGSVNKGLNQYMCRPTM